jgi:hypothetical protein
MHTLCREQYVAATLVSAWNLLKNPVNLDLITPENLQFQIFLYPQNIKTDF